MNGKIEMIKSRINKRFYSTNTKNNTKLHPNWITGFSDGESSFSVSFSEKSQNKTGWHQLKSNINYNSIRGITTLAKFK